MKYALCLIVFIASNCFSQSGDYLITTERDTLDDVKIRSNPFFTNKDKVTLKDGTIYQASDLLAYADNDKYYVSEKIDNSYLLINRLNIGPSRIYIARNPDESWDTYFYDEELDQFSFLENDNLKAEIISQLPRFTEFKETSGKLKQINTPFEGATLLSEYNAFIQPETYQESKYKNPDLVSFKIGLGSSYFNLKSQTDKTTGLAVVPYLGFKVDFSKIALNLNFSYLNTESEIGSSEMNLNMMGSELSLDILLWRGQSSSIYINGGFLVALIANNEVTNIVETNTSNNFNEAYQIKFAAAPSFGLKVVTKDRKNRRFELITNYVSSTLKAQNVDAFVGNSTSFEIDLFNIGINYSPQLY